jgi:hypothetical protein
LRAKSGLNVKVTTLLPNLKIAGVNVTFIRCDDSGENKDLFENANPRVMVSRLDFLLKLPGKRIKSKDSFKPSLEGLELFLIALD